MTAEVSVINQQGIALAADSAVTLRTENHQKIFTSANKIFCLSKEHPVGIMVYGNADILGVPWETVVKIYSDRLGDKKLNTLGEYCESFLDFLRINRTLFPAGRQRDFNMSNIGGYFNFVNNEAKESLTSELKKKNKLTQKEIEKIIAAVIDREYKMWDGVKLLPGATKTKVDAFKRKYIKDIRKVRRDAFEKMPITQARIKKLEQIACWIPFKFVDERYTKAGSGIVVGGYGEKDVFPSLRSYLIEGVVDGFLKFKEAESIDSKDGVGVIPFAQKEMVGRFIEGVDPLLERFVYHGLHELADQYSSHISNKLKLKGKKKAKIEKEIQKEITNANRGFLQEFQKFKRDRFVNPILQVVGMLPRDELAVMAETLVTLTSFKRRVSMEDETVGGPVDVVVISKSDGFVWVKRKEYFDRNIQD